MAKLVSPLGIAVNGYVGEVHSTRKNALGTIAYDADAPGDAYIYLKGVASTVDGSFVVYDEAYATVLAVADAQGGVAIARAAVVADKYGWYPVEGSHQGLCLASFVDNGKVYLTATPGSVDDSDVAGDAVIGVIGRSARDTTTGQALFQLIGRPMVMDLAID